MGNEIEKEPVLIWATVGALIGALLTRFVPDLGGDLINQIVDFVVVVGPVAAGAYYARGKVRPIAKMTIEELDAMQAAMDDGL